MYIRYIYSIEFVLFFNIFGIFRLFKILFLLIFLILINCCYNSLGFSDMNINVRKLLYEIKKVCVQRNVHLTPQRLAVLNAISKQCDGSISAYSLLNLLRQSSFPNAKPVTIYRALNFLLDQGFIHRIESTNSFMLCRYFLELTHDFSFFICNHCKKVTEQTTTGIMEVLQNTAKVTGFIMSHSIIEARGTCISCLRKLQQIH